MWNIRGFVGKRISCIKELSDTWYWVDKVYYTTTWKISAIWLAQSSGISAQFEILTCENYKPFAGSSINK